jgi:GR25 family glycosyltransferase involved in LPS biosynthesis
MEFLKSIPVVVIHRKENTDRDIFIETFEKKMGLEIQRIDAMNGEELCKQPDLPRKHPREPTPTSEGNIGCTFSHVGIYETFLTTKYDYILVLEDDIELVCEPSDINDYIENSFALPEWDLLFLGVNEIVEGTKVEEYPLISYVQRFWGTHAVIATRKAAEAIVREFRQSIASGFALPADWLYSFTIQHQNLVAYSPSDPRTCVQQKEGLVSTCTGKLRLYT